MLGKTILKSSMSRGAGFSGYAEQNVRYANYWMTEHTGIPNTHVVAATEQKKDQCIPLKSVEFANFSTINQPSDTRPQNQDCMSHWDQT